MNSKFNIKSELIKSVFVLTSGTALAQLISYISMPFITRLYSPEDFGEFGIMMRIVAVLALIGAARYEYAIPLPKKNENAFHIYRFALKILVWTVSLSFLSGAIYWLLRGYSERLLIFIVLIIVITTFTVFINIGKHWAIRMKWFKKVTLSNLLTSGTGNVAKLLTGIAGFGFFGLAISTLIGVFVGSIIYFFDAVGNYKNKNYRKSKLRSSVLAREYREFPRVQLPHTLIDAGRDLLIAFLLTMYFSTSLFGSYDHSYRMLRIPLLLIGASIGQVLYSRISEDFANRKDIYPLLKKSVVVLILIGIAPFTVIYFWGAPIFAFVFGDQWLLSGQIAAVLSPWLMANFVASSISMVPSIIGKLRWFFWIGVGTTVIQLSCFIFLPELMAAFQIDEVEILALISWLMFIVFSIIIIWELKIVKEVEYKA